MEKNDIDPLIGDSLLFKVALAKRKYDVPNTVSGTSASIPLTIGVYGVWFTPVVRKFAFALVSKAWRLMVEDFLVLETVKFRGDEQVWIHSLENRRMYCLKQHQQCVRPWIVYVRLRCNDI